MQLLPPSEPCNKSEISLALEQLSAKYDQDSPLELLEVSTGFRIQLRSEYALLIAGLWEEKPSRYSKALLETLALIAYRQPITRGEIETIRGVAISTSIFKTLLDERGWIRVVGHRAVPGKPALYATTKVFLDYFGLKSLDQLPLLPELASTLQDHDNYEKIPTETLAYDIETASTETQDTLVIAE